MDKEGRGWRGVLDWAAASWVLLPPPGPRGQASSPWWCRAEDWCRVYALQLCVWPGVGCWVRDLQMRWATRGGDAGRLLRHVRTSDSLRTWLRAQSFYFIFLPGHLCQGSGTHAIRFRRQTPAASSDGHKRDG